MRNVVLPQSVLVPYLQAKLDIAWSACANHRIGAGHIWSRTGETKRIWHRRVNVPQRSGVGKVGVIENIEEFRTELHAYALVDLSGFHQREVPVVESRASEEVAAHSAELPRLWRDYHSA